VKDVFAKKFLMPGEISRAARSPARDQTPMRCKPRLRRAFLHLRFCMFAAQTIENECTLILAKNVDVVFGVLSDPA
jgi:hypothetical protein